MARYFSPQVRGVLDGAAPNSQAAGNVQHAKLSVIKASIDLATFGATITTADEVVLGMLPTDATFMFGIITSSVTMGASAALAIGTSPTHATNGQYRAAAVQTAADAPAMFGLTAAMVAAATTAPTPLYLTVGVANLPGAGRLDILIAYTTRK